MFFYILQCVFTEAAAVTMADEMVVGTIYGSWRDAKTMVGGLTHGTDLGSFCRWDCRLLY